MRDRDSKRKKMVTALAVALMMVLCTAIPVSAKSRTPKKLYLKTTTTVVDIGGKTKVSVKKTKPSKASRSVRWKSSNKKIAVVSSKGVVTGKKKGTVRITATSKRNRRIRKSITVKVKDLKSTSLKLNRKQVTLGNKEAVTLKATLKGPKGYCNRGVVWKSSNPAIVSVSKSGKLTVKGTGSASVTAQEKGGSRKATCKVEAFQTLSAKRVWQNLKRKEADYGKKAPQLILDVRLTAGTGDEDGYQNGHIPTAVNCSAAKEFQDANSLEEHSGNENIQRTLQRFGKERNFVLVGNGEQYERHAAELLRKNGVNPERIFVLAEKDGAVSGKWGMDSWKQTYPNYVTGYYATGSYVFHNDISGEQLQEDIDGPKLYTVLDARATEQYDLAHAPGAWSTPCRKGDDYKNAYNAILNPEARKDNFKEVVEKNPNAIFAIICYSGTRYSNNAKETLMKDYGIPEERIIVQRGGMSKWNGTVVSAPKVDAGAGTVTIATKVNKALESNPQMKTGMLVASESGTRKEEGILRTYVTPEQMSEAMTELKAKAGKTEVCASVQWNDFRKTGGGTLPEILNNLKGQPAMLYAAESNDRNSETGEIAALTSDSDALFGISNRPATEDNLCTVKSGALPKSDHEMSASFSPDEHNVVYLTFTLK